VASITTIVVPDAAATPVNHTFSKVKVDGDTAIFNEKSSVSSLGYWQLALTHRLPLAGQAEKVYRDTLMLSCPVVYNEVINGITRPSMGYSLRTRVEFITPAESVIQNRKDQRKLTVGILNDTSFVGMYENQENIS
jgi:hypothetical protein